MSGNQRVGGVIKLQAGGVRLKVKGGATYNLGVNKRETVMGADGPHGHTEKPQIAFIEADITDDPSLDVKALAAMKNATVTLELANGKTILLHQAVQVGELTFNTDEGNGTVRFEGISAEEIGS